MHDGSQVEMDQTHVQVIMLNLCISNIIYIFKCHISSVVSFSFSHNFFSYLVNLSSFNECSVSK